MEKQGEVSKGLIVCGDVHTVTGSLIAVSAFLFQNVTPTFCMNHMPSQKNTKDGATYVVLAIPPCCVDDPKWSDMLSDCSSWGLIGGCPSLFSSSCMHKPIYVTDAVFVLGLVGAAASSHDELAFETSSFESVTLYILKK